jgi:CubicO group peptidase (beta-lactamase class C family)
MSNCGIMPLVAAALAGCAPVQAVRVASAYTSHMICSGAFISGLPPEEVYAQSVGTNPGFGLIDWALRYEVDPAKRQVTTTIAGGFGSRAVFRDELGCLVVHGEATPEVAPSKDQSDPAPSAPPLLPEIAGPEVVEPGDAAMQAALDRAFAEPGRASRRLTKAIVVIRDGRVIAERYAPGYGVDTPLLGNSMTKSMTSALIGILVRQRRLAVNRPAPVPAWRDPRDPRHGITIDNLLRQNSGLDIDETGSGFDPVSRMLMLEDDMAAFAEAAPLAAPSGSRWRYTSGNYIILSHIVRDAVGGNAEAVLRFVRRELFDPLGMRSATLEFDATGTPAGSTFMFASARDWARLGMLYIDDGVISGHRILPKGWARYSTSPTAGSYYGYGAGWWTSLAPTKEAEKRNGTELPPGAFFANGRLGQFILVVPSERLVVARLGTTQQPGLGDDGGIAPLLADVIAAIHARARSADPWKVSTDAP